jgi:superfamily II DNA or RNA helicase
MNNPSGGQITIANFKVIGTGITIKHIQSIILVTSQSSVTKVIQAIGRGLRI